jgi:glycosyltransferase involved in cell wall biosynthesis
MRIAHVITRMILGGAQENTLLTCEDLMRDFGDDVLLITGPPLGPEGSLLERARANGVPTVVLPELRREIHLGRDWTSYGAIKRELRSFQPDVVHTHSGKAGLLGRMAATAINVPAIVHTVHGASFHKYQSRGVQAVLRWCEKFAATRCDLFVSVANAMTEQMVAAQVAPREKFVTVYSGMEVEPLLESGQLRDEVRQHLGYKPRDIVIGKIARLFHLKGHEYVLRAAGQVIGRHPQAKFLFVGDGVLDETLREQVHRQHLDPHVKFTGLVPPDEIPGLIAAMDVIVHASFREGLARVLPQALIAGKPVVSYDIDGAREVVIPGETGYLLPPGSTEPMVAAINELIERPDLREKLGGEGRRRFADQFRHERMTLRLRELYEELLAAKRTVGQAF